MLSENEEKNARESVATALDNARRCINNVREYYTSLSNYPVIGSGLHDVHIYDGAYICQKTKASVSASGKVNWVGEGKFYDAKSSDIVKNAKTKIIINIDGKSYFLDLFFIYEK